VLVGAPAVATTEVEEDVDGRPLVRCYRELWQQPPLKLRRQWRAPWEVPALVLHRST
jgi:hypothetical protein